MIGFSRLTHKNYIYIQKSLNERTNEQNMHIIHNSFFLSPLYFRMHHIYIMIRFFVVIFLLFLLVQLLSIGMERYTMMMGWLRLYNSTSFVFYYILCFVRFIHGDIYIFIKMEHKYTRAHTLKTQQYMKNSKYIIKHTYNESQ